MLPGVNPLFYMSTILLMVENRIVPSRIHSLGEAFFAWGTTMRRLITLTICLFLSTTAFAVADEAEAIAAIEKLGGTVRQIAQDSEDKEAAFHLSGKELTDDDLAAIKEVSNLVWLNLANTKISDAGLKHLSGIKSLTRLHLEKTQIGDAGLAHLKGLENLEYLNLYGTQVSDAGLDHLKELPRLKKLYLWQSKVSKEAANTLNEALAKVDVNIGAELKAPPKTLAKGQYVRVRLPGDKKILQIAELQILETGSGEELQKSASARQSSSYKDGEAKKAIDGNTEQDFNKGSVSHTNEQKDPWFVVDLGGVKDISTIKLFNRGDCCGDRLTGAVIEIIDAGLNVIWSETISEAADKSVAEYVGK